MFLSIIIPTYNSSKFIESTLDDVIDSMRMSDFQWELILVDDSSSDDTFRKASNFLSKKNINFKTIQLMKNVGQNIALFTGIKQSKGKFVVTMDDDMEVPAIEINKVLNALLNDASADVLIGISKKDERSPIRQLGTKLHNNFNHFFYKVNFQASGFRIIRRSIVDTTTSFKTKAPHLGFLLIKSTKRIKNIHIQKNTGARKSNYSLVKLVKLFISNTFNYTSLPLDLVSSMGILTCSVSTMYGVFILVQYFTGFPKPISNPGWTSLITAMFFLSGLILLSLGIIGKYIMRLIFEMTDGKISHARNYVEGSNSNTKIKKAS